MTDDAGRTNDAGHGTGEIVNRWDLLTSPEAREAADRDPVLVLPVAAVEQHGPHLPLSTDVDIGQGILARAVRSLDAQTATRTFVLPGLAAGVSPEHTRFAGTLSVDAATFESTLLDLGAALDDAGVRRLLVVNSHGGNKAVLDTAALRLRQAFGMLVVKASWFRFPRPEGGAGLPDAEWEHGLHGGAVETAMMMHLHSDRVRNERLQNFPSMGEELEATMAYLRPEGAGAFAWMAHDLNPHGVTGNALLATPELGATLVDHYGGVLAGLIQDTLRFPVERLNGPV